ncbi:MAG: hypothetical protein LQ352_004072 [Teloschistes flavicans]|nr:MAG: hypothetical protein LQ352_004072 [Teloschistes flavicans]
MDSPDRMSWTPSSSAKKRKLAEFEHIQTSPQLYIPGAYPPSPTVSINANNDSYQSSPTPHPRIIPGPVPAHSDGLMHNYLQVPQFWGPLVQMINQAGNTATATLSNTLGIFAGPGARFAHCLRNNAGPLYVAIQAVGNTAKRIKLTLRPNRTEVPPQHTTSPEQPSTPTQRTSRNLKRSPSPTLRSQTSILHHAREIGLRKSRATVHWVEEQKLFEQLIHERETVDLAVVDCVQNNMQPMDGLQFEPMMSGALPIDDPQAQGDTDMLADESTFDSQGSYESELMIQSDNQESAFSGVSSDITDSVTSSMLAGLTEEDLKNIETKQEKKQRVKEERRAAAETKAAIIQENEEIAARDPTCFLAQLRLIAKSTAIPEPSRKSVAFFQNPKTGNPVATIKTFDCEDPITPPVKPFLPASRAAMSAIRPYVIEASVAQETRMPATPSSTAETPSPINIAKKSSDLPEVVSSFAEFKLSNRRVSLRQDEIEVEAQLKRDKEARLKAEAADRAAKAEVKRRALEEGRVAEERIRLGIRRMPIHPVIQPLNDEWNGKVDTAMRAGLTSGKELAKCSDGTPVTRRDLGHVLPQQGDRTGGWLNDTIINGYLQSVTDYAKKMRGVKRGELPKVHAFSSFLYESLKNRGYEGVQSWTRRAKFGGKDILKMEKIFIPINKGGNHWVLIYISPQTKTIEYFDSFHSPPGRIVDDVKKWLKGELREAFVDSEWTLLQGGGPTQNNASDCGVFVSATAKMIVLGVDPMHFSAADMPTQRRVIVAELLNGGIDGPLAPNVTF